MHAALTALNLDMSLVGTQSFGLCLSYCGDS